MLIHCTWLNAYNKILTCKQYVLLPATLGYHVYLYDYTDDQSDNKLEVVFSVIVIPVVVLH